MRYILPQRLMLAAPNTNTKLVMRVLLAAVLVLLVFRNSTTITLWISRAIEELIHLAYKLSGV